MNSLDIQDALADDPFSKTTSTTILVPEDKDFQDILDDIGPQDID